MWPTVISPKLFEVRNRKLNSTRNLKRKLNIDICHVADSSRSAPNMSDRSAPTSIVEWATRYATQCEEWGGVFRLIPTDNKRRRDALAAALKLKQAVKALRALLAMGQSGAAATKIGSSSESGDGAAAVADVTALTAAAVETPSDGDGGDATASTPSEGSSSSSSAAAKAERMREKRLHGAHLVLKEVTQALLEVTFPLEEEVAKRFDDNAAFSACTRRCVDQRRRAAVCKYCLAPLISYTPPRPCIPPPSRTRQS